MACCEGMLCSGCAEVARLREAVNQLSDQLAKANAHRHELLASSKDAGRLRDQLVAALEPLIEIAEDHCDSGPIGEGWQSDKLVAQIAAAREALAAGAK